MIRSDIQGPLTESQALYGVLRDIVDARYKGSFAEAAEDGKVNHWLGVSHAGAREGRRVQFDLRQALGLKTERGRIARLKAVAKRWSIGQDSA